MGLVVLGPGFRGQSSNVRWLSVQCGFPWRDKDGLRVDHSGLPKVGVPMQFTHSMEHYPNEGRDTSFQW